LEEAADEAVAVDAVDHLGRRVGEVPHAEKGQRPERLCLGDAFGRYLLPYGPPTWISL
jgi:hypothetical protein